MNESSYGIHDKSIVLFIQLIVSANDVTESGDIGIVTGENKRK